MTSTPGLGRQLFHDPRSIQPKFLVRNHRAAISSTQTPRSYTWGLAEEHVLNQLSTPRCVGYSGAHEIAARPSVYPVTAATGDNVYLTAQRIDRAEGRHWEEGASILAGAKALRELGFLKTFRWAKSAFEFAVGVSRIGPGWLGVDWTDEMFEPDADGYIWPNGTTQGGHAVLDRAYRTPASRTTYRRPSAPFSNGRHTIQNSWGPSWGGRGTIKLGRAPKGCAFMTDEALQSLLDRPYADACIPEIRI